MEDLPPIPNELDIWCCREDNDGYLGAVIGYVAIGYWSLKSFAIVVNKEYYLTGDSAICTRNVKHGWLLNNQFIIDSIQPKNSRAFHLDDLTPITFVIIW